MTERQGILRRAMSAAGAVRTGPPPMPKAEIIQMADHVLPPMPDVDVEQLTPLGREIIQALIKYNVAKNEVARAENELEEMQTRMLARERELNELRQEMFAAMTELEVVSGPPPGGEHGTV